MKFLKRLIVIGGLVLLVLGVVAWKVPASWIIDRMDLSRQSASYARITGTLWQGTAEQFKWRDLMLGEVVWDFQTVNQLNPLITTWKVDGKGLDYEMSLLADIEGRQTRDFRLVQGFIPAGWVDMSKVIPLVFLTGRFHFDLDHASPTGNAANLATGTIRWNDAGLSGLVEESLGTIVIDMRSENRFTIADIQSEPGSELQINGNVKFNGSQYRTELVMQASPEKQYVVEELAHLGKVLEDGSLEINLAGRIPR